MVMSAIDEPSLNGLEALDEAEVVRGVGHAQDRTHASANVSILNQRFTKAKRSVLHVDVAEILVGKEKRSCTRPGVREVAMVDELRLTSSLPTEFLVLGLGEPGVDQKRLPILENRRSPELECVGKTAPGHDSFIHEGSFDDLGRLPGVVL